MRQAWFKAVQKAAPEMPAVQAFEDFVAMAFYLLLGDRDKALAVGTLANGGEERKDAFANALLMLGDAMEKYRFEDLLGEVHQEIRGTYSQQGTGSFYTPPSLCRVMAQMNADHEKIRDTIAAGGIIRVSDPSIGAGRTLLALAELYPDHLSSFRFFGTDIELNACRMAFLNMALNGMAAEVIHGNGITLETWQVWHTPEWKFYEGERILQRIGRIMHNVKSAVYGNPTTPESTNSQETLDSSPDRCAAPALPAPPPAETPPNSTTTPLKQLQFTFIGNE